MADALCLTSILATTIRATKVNACGLPVVGAGNAGVSDGIISVAIQPQVQDGTEIVVLNGAGKVTMVGAPPSSGQMRTVRS